MNIPNVGYGVIEQYLDFNNNLLTQYIPSINFCQKFSLPFSINLQDIFNKMEDPSSGLLVYLGETTIPWAAGTSAYEYQVNSPIADYPDTQYLYFSTITKRLNWAYKPADN